VLQMEKVLQMEPVRRLIASAILMLTCYLVPEHKSWHPANEQSPAIEAAPAPTAVPVQIHAPRVIPRQPTQIRFFPQRPRIARSLLASERLPFWPRPKRIWRHNFS
jgi:hypothetical protein